MSGSSMASPPYKSAVSVAVKDIQPFRREMEVEIVDFQKTSPAMNREIRAFVQNDDLTSIGMLYGETKWVLVVETAVLHKHECALKVAIGLDLLTGNRAITFNASMVEIQVLVNGQVCKTAKYKGKRYDFDSSSKGLFTLDHADYFVRHPCISSGPCKTINLRVKATVEFKVLFVGGTPASLYGDIHAMGELYRNKGDALLKIFSSDGKWVAVHDDHLSLVNPIFKELIEERATAQNELILNVKDGLDGETLKVILDECYSRRTFRFALAGKALLAARKFKLVSLEGDCLRSYLDGINAGNVVEALEFSWTHSIDGVNEKVIEVLTRSVKKDPIGVALEKLNKVAKFNVPGLKEKFAELLGEKLQSLDMEDAVDALKLFSGQGFAGIEKKLMERVSDPATAFPMEQAADVLRTSSQLTQPGVKKMVVKRIVENMDEFIGAGGFRELKAEDGLQRLIEEEVIQQKAKKQKTG